MSRRGPPRLPAVFRYAALGVAAVAGAASCSGSSGSSERASDAGITDGAKVADGAADAAPDGPAMDGAVDTGCPLEGYCGNVMDVADASCPNMTVCTMFDCPAPCTFI